MTVDEANAILNIFGQRLREVPIEQAAEATKNSTFNGKDGCVIIPAQEDYLPLVLIYLKKLVGKE